MRKLNKFLLIIFVIITFSACTKQKNTYPEYAKNVILIIGDGMGENQIEVSKIIHKDIKFNYDDLINKGYVRTSTYDNSLTDSAAAATAMATGVKTNREIVGKSFDKSRDLENILEIAHRNNIRTGLITDVALYDATPAAFSSHVNDRYFYRDDIIKTQINNNYIDVIMGLDPAMYYEDKSTIIKNGYDFIINKSNLLTSTNSKIFGVFEKVSSGEDNFPNLNDMVSKALSTLKNDNGFVLIVEAGSIDKSIGNNNINQMADNILEMDKALGSILDFLNDNPDTLVIVTADHETGGLIIKDGMPDESWFTEPELYHTPVDVPIKVLGAYANKIMEGTIENTEIFKIMINALQLN